MATPHINAEMGDFADVVLMPGDPLRAKHIAETFLEDVREVNNVRGMLGFTGTYKGRKISVMGHGMGIPSCSIYTKELITDFGVKKIIRVGSCGAVRADVKLRDVVIGMGACTDSKVNRLRFKDHDFADVVLMPGDPLRAKHIAETFLEDVREVNNVRGMLGFTGTYKGRKISVMGHGMGIPSCSIYTKELITDFGVKKIIRVGSCGAVRMDVKLRDVVIGMGACTDSKVNRIRFKDHDFAAIADFDMVRNAVDAAKALGVDARVGNLFSADLFYSPDGEMFDVMEKYGVLGVEMEAAGIYGVAAEFGAKALTICTVSDHIRTHEQTTAAERQTTFNDMIKIALESVLLGDKE